MTPRLLAGTARADITPPVGIAQANWGAQTHERAQGVDLDLWATALALRDAQTGVTALLIDLDLGWLYEPVAVQTRDEVARLTGVPRENIRLAYTHTHSGPSLGEGTTPGVRSGEELVPAYVASLPGRIAGVAWEALNNLEPARAAAGAGTCRININRRDRRPDGRVITGRGWEGPVDPMVGVVRLDDLAEEPIATLVHYSCHPTIMGPPCTLITPDYPGVVRRVVEESLGGTCLFLQGATGNQAPIVGYVGDPAVYHLAGQRVGLVAAGVAANLVTLPRRQRFVQTLESGAPLGIYADEPADEPDLHLAVLSRTVQMPARDYGDPADWQAQSDHWVAETTRARERGDEEAVQDGNFKARRAAMRAQVARRVAGKSSLPIEVHALRIGDIALVGTPLEPFVEIGFAVRERSPFPVTLFSGYSNEGWAYVPTAADYPLGGYEVEITPFAPGADQALVEGTLETLQELWTM